jgi:thymidylate synthase ThyX
MAVTATVIADSIADGCPRLTTLQLRYPRFIHAEVMTHRVFSRNASSSRAIPIERMIQDVIDDPAMPVHWGKNQPGMQAREELPEFEQENSLGCWVLARDQVVKYARHMAGSGLHKQIVNRILEPFQHINVLVTATEWDNFFALRDHPDAQPEIQALARAMKEAMAGSEPRFLKPGSWHKPYINADDYNNQGDMRMVSAARCASVSYKTVDGKPMSVDKALEIFDKLAGSDPIHASPFEHIARPDPDNGPGCRNFTKWHQWRADLEGN